MVLSNYKNLEKHHNAKEKVNALVQDLRLTASDPALQSKELLIPNNCEQYGFVSGYHSLTELLQFLADMLEE
jgi:hypothetical protein